MGGSAAQISIKRTPSLGSDKSVPGLYTCLIDRDSIDRNSLEEARTSFPGSKESFEIMAEAMVHKRADETPQTVQPSHSLDPSYVAGKRVSSNRIEFASAKAN